MEPNCEPITENARLIEEGSCDGLFAYDSARFIDRKAAEKLMQ